MKYVIGILVGVLLSVGGTALANTDNQWKDEVWYPLIGVINDLTTQISRMQKEIADLRSQNTYLQRQLNVCDGLAIGFEKPTVNEVQSSGNVGSEPADITNNTLNVVTDKTPPFVSVFEITYLDKRSDPPMDNGAPAGHYLRITTDEEIDIESISGVEVLEVTYSNHNDGVTKTKGKPAYYTEARITKPNTKKVQVTFADLNGNEVSRSANVN